ncbi:MAG: Stp1/IreP family PP2C-type Ser/Thr phosphatase [Clostridia bacterium]|nr:Stp1/IreP family PP2C-type Ser/Thr phosphatase [Clostridia bacterium]
MLIAGRTDKGQKRPVNQDEYLIRTVGSDAYLAVVCDGMGGAAAGDLASKTAAECFASFVCGNYGLCDDAELLREALYNANSLVHDISSENPECEGMGTTLVAALVTSSGVTVINVGDSRLYLVENGQATQITRDHTLVQMLVDRGELSLREAKTSRSRNLITRCVGVESTVEPDVFSFERREGDVLVLCTDGFHSYTDREALPGMIRSGSFDELEKTAESFVALANSAGGSDNITVVLLRM